MKNVDLVVIGGGPAGLCATISAASSGSNVLLIERSKKLGGQLVKQTHMFFGSEKQYASIRGIDISNILLKEIEKYKDKIEIMEDTTVLGIYEDGIITAENKGKYIKIRPKAVVVATGASEKASAFPNNDLPGIYGAGAVQTLMNVYGVLPGKRALMVGAGNIGLIIAYQLMQAGVDVAAVIHHSPRIGGYHVHASKIQRMGVPILTNHAIKEAKGKDNVESVVIHELDRDKNPIPGSEKKLDVDTICVSVGLSPLTELLAQAGCELEYVKELSGLVPVIDDRYETSVKGIFVAGDTAGVEEASMAMVEGYLSGLYAAESLGYRHPDFDKLAEDYRSQLAALRRVMSGEKKRMDLPDAEKFRNKFPSLDRINEGPVAIIECFQEIPCNPCTIACNRHAIAMMEDINDLPQLDIEKCNGCALCVSKCPGLAIMVVDGSYSDDEALFKIPYEFTPLPKDGDIVKGLDRFGNYLTDVKIVKVQNLKSFDRTPLIHAAVNKDYIYEFRNIRMGDI
jgi:sarcosine oxidase subunit alpha